jgi:Na+/glutamate symporter
MKGSVKKLLRNFAIEMLVYAVLVTVYFILVLRTLGGWLTELYYSNLPLYAVVALVLIVTQGVMLEWLTSFLVERLGLERLE